MYLSILSDLLSDRLGVWIPCDIIKANNNVKEKYKADHDSKYNENNNESYQNNSITIHSKGMSSTE